MQVKFLLAYMILLTPCGLQELAHASIRYNDLDTRHWSEGNRTIEYTYDDNGSVTGKTIWDDKGDSDPYNDEKLEEITYEYNLQNRLERVTTDNQAGTEFVTEYTYNDNGIRVRAYSYDTPDGGTTRNSEKTVVYLVDSYNPTGYAQVLEELVFNHANPDPLTETPDSCRTYTIGDDVITQYEASAGAEHLLYDGHGSTRQLVDNTGNGIVDSFSYDAYGVMLGGNAGSKANPNLAATNLFYAGEYFDTDLQHYYNRARWYKFLNS